MPSTGAAPNPSDPSNLRNRPMRNCSCPVCRRGRGEDMIGHYMRVFAVAYPEAVELLASESRSMWVAAVSGMSRLHGLDDDGAVSHVLTHAVRSPERMQ